MTRLAIGLRLVLGLAVASTSFADEPKVPEGSADYAKMLTLTARYKRGELSFDKLQRAVIAAHLPPHPLGCAYLVSPVPAPPPGIPFDPKLMPPDWTHTFGEVTMTHFAGQLTLDEYDRLHRAAHGKLASFPNCGRAAK